MSDIKNLERTLWAAADKLRSNMDAAEYKHVVLGLIFLKYISDAFNGRYDQLKLELEDANNDWYVAEGEARYQTLNDKDEYASHNAIIQSKNSFLSAGFNHLFCIYRGYINLI